MPKIRKHWLYINLLALALVFIHISMFNGAVGRFLEPLLIDVWFNIRGSRPTPQQVVIVAIDVDSYYQQDLSFIEPWPRPLITALLEQLKDYGVKGVVLDLLFESQHRDSQIDNDLAAALKLQPTVIASYLRVSENALNGLQVFNHQPQAAFRDAAFAAADVWIPYDKFNVARRFPRRGGLENEELLSMAVAGAKLVRDDFNMPTARDYLNYYGRKGSLPTVSFSDVLEAGDNYAELFRDKVVYVGYTLDIDTPGAVSDSFATPFHGQPLFGVEIHATATLNLLHDDWIQRLPPDMEIMILNVAVFLLGLLAFTLKPTWSIAALSSATSIWAISSYQAFLNEIYLPGATAFLIVLPAGCLCSAVYHYRASAKREKQMKDVCSRYLSPAMAEEALHNCQHLIVADKLVEGAIMFTDIAGYTSAVQNMNPRQVKIMLNHYFSAAVSCVVERHGTPLRFLGDGMMAIWTSADSQTPADDNALLCAVELPQRIQALTSNKIIPHLPTRIAIHRGQVSMGDLGGKEHTDYTVIGDAVNVAARLEQLNKTFGTELLISETVKSALKQEYPLLFLGLVQVVGKDKPLGIYSVFSDQLIDKCEKLWQQALSAFSTKGWQNATDLFTAVAKQQPPLAKAAAFYQQQTTLYADLKLPETWQGEIIFSEKPK